MKLKPKKVNELPRGHSLSKQESLASGAISTTPCGLSGKLTSLFWHVKFFLISFSTALAFPNQNDRRRAGHIGGLDIAPSLSPGPWFLLLTRPEHLDGRTPGSLTAPLAHSPSHSVAITTTRASLSSCFISLVPLSLIWLPHVFS